MTVKLLPEQLYSLIGDCTGLSESTLLKRSHCWKSHAPLKVFIYIFTKKQDNLGLELQCILKVKEYLSKVLNFQDAKNNVSKLIKTKIVSFFL